MLFSPFSTSSFLGITSENKDHSPQLYKTMCCALGDLKDDNMAAALDPNKKQLTVVNLELNMKELLFQMLINLLHNLNIVGGF
jgi:hypothetical protein